MSAIFLLFSGSFGSSDNTSELAWIIKYLSFGRYGFEGTALATYSFQREKLVCYESYCHFRNPSVILKELGIPNDNYELDIVALVLTFLVLRIFGYISLSLKIRSSKIQS